jgi:DNA polymerase III gamma/tau subunit
MLRHQARHYALGQIRSFIQAIGRALRQLEQNANPRLVLENLMLDIPEEGKAVYA